MNRSGARRRAGFSLAEVLVAVTILEVGLLAVVGTLLTAQRFLARAQLVHRATQDAAQVGDSLARWGGDAPGERTTAWGRVRWSAGAIVAEAPSGAVLLAWELPPLSGSPP